jgi:hypothetical protein
MAFHGAAHSQSFGLAVEGLQEAHIMYDRKSCVTALEAIAVVW